jgi:acyl-coenzyme A thioesterase PaaI-like protein
MSSLHESHRHCVVCGSDHPFGLHLDFIADDDGSVEARIECESLFQGYPGMVHGGIVSMLLDGAMTNCLFAHGQPGVTGELNVRFGYPVEPQGTAVVRAWIDESPPPFFVLKSELIQTERVCARATAKFVNHPHLQPGDEEDDAHEFSR